MRFRHFILHCIGLASALILTVDVALYVSQTGGLCQTQSCQAVGEYVRFGEGALRLVGAAFFWVLWLVFFLATRVNKPIVWHLASLSLLGALAFDGGLLGYQFVGLQLQCWLCIGVGAALFANLFSLAWVRQSWMIPCIGIAVWMGGFAANATLVVAPKAVQTSQASQIQSLEQSAFVSSLTQNGPSNRDYYLFFSFNCGHCQEVLASLAMNAPFAVNWHLCSLDGSGPQLAQLAWVRAQAEGDTDQKENIFFLTLKAKQEKAFMAEHIPDQIKTAVDQAREFFASRGYRGVPLLVAKEGRGREVVLTGTANIARYLYEEDVIKQWARP
jgi:hypothetical protein